MRAYRFVILTTAVSLATTGIMTAAEHTEVSKITIPEPQAWNRVLGAEQSESAKRLLRSEKSVSTEEKEVETEEERVMPGTAAAEQLIPKLEKALSNKQLVRNSEEIQFSLWFITGRSPDFVAENIWQINPLASSGKYIAKYHRYVQWFSKYFALGGIKFHFN